MPGLGCLRSCLGRIILTILLVGAAYAGWRWGPQVFPPLQEFIDRIRPPEQTQALSEELAVQTLDDFEAFRLGDSGGRLVLGNAQLGSVLRYRLPGLLPEGVNSPTISMDDGVLRLRARVARESFPSLPALEGILGFLPDTLALEMEGALAPLEDDRWVALVIHRMEASRIPLPDRLIPEILRALGRENVGGLPPDAVAVPMPDGLESAFVLRDSLVLIADR